MSSNLKFGAMIAVVGALPYPHVSAHCPLKPTQGVSTHLLLVFFNFMFVVGSLLHMISVPSINRPNGAPSIPSRVLTARTVAFIRTPW
jgi:hypothetical protein